MYSTRSSWILYPTQWLYIFNIYFTNTSDGVSMWKCFVGRSRVWWGLAGMRSGSSGAGHTSLSARHWLEEEGALSSLKHPQILCHTPNLGHQQIQKHWDIKTHFFNLAKFTKCSNVSGNLISPVMVYSKLFFFTK